MEITFKATILVLLAVLSWLFCKVIQSGSRIQTTRDTLSHKSLATSALTLTVILVVLLEIAVRFGTAVPRGNLFAVHLGFALPFIVSLVSLRFWLTGLRYGKAHRYVAYGCLSAFAGTLLTGIWLMFS
jgi:hypothetical protein